VKFKSGAGTYFDVPAKAHSALMADPSAGKHLNEHFKGKYRYEAADTTPKPPTPAPVAPRRVVQDFALALEQTLLRNDGKPCWSEMTTLELLDKLREEFSELERELLNAEDVPGAAVRVGYEAIDLAAVSMFAWDRVQGAGAASTNRGRS
jgi:hypothetical protein